MNTTLGEMFMFSIEGGVASWQTPGESGSKTIDEPAFYTPNESAAIAAAHFTRRSPAS